MKTKRKRQMNEPNTLLILEPELVALELVPSESMMSAISMSGIERLI